MVSRTDIAATTVDIATQAKITLKANNAINTASQKDIDVNAAHAQSDSILGAIETQLQQLGDFRSAIRELESSLVAKILAGQNENYANLQCQLVEKDLYYCRKENSVLPGQLKFRTSEIQSLQKQISDLKHTDRTHHPAEANRPSECTAYMCKTP